MPDRHEKRQRLGRVPERPLLDVGSGWTCRPGAHSGPVSTFDRLAEYPAKVPGEHRWAVALHYSLSEQAIRSGRATTDRENLTEIDIYCIDCRRIWADVEGQPCGSDLPTGS